MPSEEWRRPFGGWGRDGSRRKQCALAMSCVNNEMCLSGYEFHSPKEIHTILISYGSDARFGLERNIGRSGGKPECIEDLYLGYNLPIPPLIHA